MTIFRLARYAESANLAAVTTSSAIVKAVAPVTSPVCVAFVTFAVLAAISVLIALANLAAVTASSAIFEVVTASLPTTGSLSAGAVPI